MESHPKATALSLQELSKDLGWSLAGITLPNIPAVQKNFYSTWLKEFGGDRLGYLKEKSQERLDPKSYFPPVKSILCFGLSYFPGWAQGEVKISNYAWGPDYHEVLKSKLEETARWIEVRLGKFEYKVCVDTAPALEKVLAAQSGIGWQAKNTLLINPKFGSLVFLGELYTDIEISRFTSLEPMADHCGTCTRCLEACPTQALSPYQLHLDRCIAYWNLEHRGELESQTPDFSGWLAGCDICQQVCPWNRKLTPLSLHDTDFQSLTLKDAESTDWKKRTKGKALSYLPAKKWQVNLNWIRSKRDPQP
jgi:epoxyqueuosine reductase